jgi:hypothetical protein
MEAIMIRRISPISSALQVLRTVPLLLVLWRPSWKTAYPGLSSPITHVDVTYDEKWIMGTTDTYLILICTIFKDKDGKEKTGFSGCMGNRIAAPRLLKLTPLDSILAGTDNKFHGSQFSWVNVNFLFGHIMRTQDLSDSFTV